MKQAVAPQFEARNDFDVFAILLNYSNLAEKRSIPKVKMNGVAEIFL